MIRNICIVFRYENQLESLRNQSFNMEQANFATQSLKDTKTTVSMNIFYVFLCPWLQVGQHKADLCFMYILFLLSLTWLHYDNL